MAELLESVTCRCSQGHRLIGDGRAECNPTRWVELQAEDDDPMPAAKLKSRLWNAIPDLPPAKRRLAEGIATGEGLTPKQRRAAYGLLQLISTK